MVSVGARAVVSVPASSANLGPGFDCLGLALEVMDEYSVEVIGSGVEVSVTGQGAGRVATGADNLVVRSIARGFEHVGVSFPGIRLECANAIPHGRGMGSSSAAIVGGLLLAQSLLEAELPIVQLGTEIEGHPDNVAAAALGGLTLAWMDAGRGQAVSLEPRADLVLVVAVPDTSLSTSKARGLIPESLPLSDAVFNVGRSSLAVAALTGLAPSPELLLVASEDRVHQDRRASAYPDSHALVSRLRQRGVAASISGAGPTVLALGLDDAVLGQVRAEAGVSFDVRQVHLSRGAVSRLSGLAS